MDEIIQKIGGHVVALAEKYDPDYSFAALVHSGETVTFYLFKGRILQGHSALSPGARTLDLFHALQDGTKIRSGLLKRTRYKAARVCVRARSRKLSAQRDYEDADAFTPDTGNKRASFNTVMRDDFPDEAKGMFTDPLPADTTPADLARLFMADIKSWNAYAFAQDAHKDSEAKWDQGQSYDNLIARYCAPDKAYQGLVISNVTRHCPEQEAVVEERIEGDRAWVETHFQNAELDFISHDYRYEFHRAAQNAPWRLTEVWYHAAPDDLVPCL